MTSPIITSIKDLECVAADLERHLLEENFEGDSVSRQMMALAEETGELVGAVRRWAGMARRTGPFDDVEQEMADVIITAFVSVRVLGIDVTKAVNEKLAIIYSRGWRERV